MEASLEEGLREFSLKLKTIKEKDGGIFTYKYQDNLPILAQLIENKQNYTIKETYSIILSILKTYGKYINFNVSYGERMDTLLHTIRTSKLPEGKQYFLYRKIYDLVPPEEREALFFKINANNEMPLESRVLLGKKLPLLLLLFYIDNFGPKLKDVKFLVIRGFRGNLLHALLLHQIDTFDYYKINSNNNDRSINLNMNQNVWLSCLKGLLEAGVDPNMTLKKVLPSDRFSLSEENLTFLESLKPLQLHLYLYKPPYDSADIVKLFLSYGMTNSDKYFSKEYEFYSQQVKSSEAFERYKATLKNLQEILTEEVGHSASILANSQNTILRRDVAIYSEQFLEILPAILKNIGLFIKSLSESDGIEIAKANVNLFKECILFFSIQKRKNFKEKLAKTRKNRKTNLNLSMKKYKNKLTRLYDIDSLLRYKMKEIDEFIKYGTFTKAQKESHRKNSREYRNMNLPPQTVYTALENFLDYLQRLSNLNKEINKVIKEVEENLITLKEDNTIKNSFRKEVEEILANNEEYTTEEKLEKIKEILETVKGWPFIEEINSIREQVNAKLNTFSNINNRKQRYKNEINSLVENKNISTQQFLEELKRILREISV